MVIRLVVKVRLNTEKALPQKRIKSKLMIHVLCIFFRDLTKTMSRSSLEINIFKNFSLVH